MKVFKSLLLVLSFSFSINVSSQTVYVTKTGEKYHKSTCKYLKYSKKEITLKKAKELGYISCKVCKPPKAVDEKSTTKKKISLSSKPKTTAPTLTKTIATQCVGRTKSGSRCKRKTKNADGRCYQH